MKLDNIKNIIWDVDGTLWWDKNLGSRIKQEYISLLSDLISCSKLKSKSLFEQEVKKGISWSAAVSTFSGEREKKLIRIVEKRLNKSKFIKSDKKLLKLFDNHFVGYNNYILTNSTYNQAILVLKALGFNEECFPFKKIFTLDNIKEKKPSKKPFRQIIRYCWDIAESFLSVGDSITNDIIPAQELGMKTCLVGDFSEKADICLDKVYELKKYIK